MAARLSEDKATTAKASLMFVLFLSQFVILVVAAEVVVNCYTLS